jgi:hypothetical protein
LHDSSQQLFGIYHFLFETDEPGVICKPNVPDDRRPYLARETFCSCFLYTLVSVVYDASIHFISPSDPWYSPFGLRNSRPSSAKILEHRIMVDIEERRAGGATLSQAAARVPV